MPIGTCRNCGGPVVWADSEIETHLIRCLAIKPAEVPKAPITAGEGERGEG